MLKIDGILNYHPLEAEIKKVFGEFLDDINHDKITDIVAILENCEEYAYFYIDENVLTVGIDENSRLSILSRIGGAIIYLKYKSHKAKYDFLVSKIEPIYKGLSMIKDFIPESEIKDIDNFIFINIAKKLIGHRNSISETIYSYFLEAEGI